MAKAKTSEWDATASGNTEIDGINISEGCPAANVNDAIREIMSQVADARTGSDDGMVTGTAGTNNHLAKWNADGDLISASVTLSGSDSTVITGTAGGDNEIAKWNADGDLVTASVTLSGADNKVITGTPGTDGNLASWNADGDLVGSGYGVLDQDDMSSDSATDVPTQQSVKAYVDAQGWTWLTLTATTSGSNKDFTSLPSGIVEVEVFVDQVSSDGTSDFLVQFGTGGSPTTSGYVSYGGTAGAADTATETTGFVIPHNNAARISVGRMRATNISGNIWVADYTGGISTPAGVSSGGSVTLGGTFDNIRFTCGADTFDSGQIRIRYR